jgi:hypothetical protein
LPTKSSIGVLERWSIGVLLKTHSGPKSPLALPSAALRLFQREEIASSPFNKGEL